MIKGERCLITGGTASVRAIELCTGSWWRSPQCSQALPQEPRWESLAGALALGKVPSPNVTLGTNGW